jgi:DNA-binding NtrC family response regulator
MLDRLKRYRYPGNVRELENIIKRLIILGSAHLGSSASSSTSGATGQYQKPLHPGQPATVFLRDVARRAARQAEKEEILRMLERTRWNRVNAAKLLHISYRSLLYKMKEAGLDRTHTIAELGT